MKKVMKSDRMLFCPACARSIPLQPQSMRFSSHEDINLKRTCFLSNSVESGVADQNVFNEALAFIQRLQKAAKAGLPTDESAYAKLKKAYTHRLRYLASLDRLKENDNND